MGSNEANVSALEVLLRLSVARAELLALAKTADAKTAATIVYAARILMLVRTPAQAITSPYSSTR